MKHTFKMTNQENMDVEVTLEITKEMARKVLEESEEIEVGDETYIRPAHGGVIEFSSDSISLYNYFKEQDNLLAQKTYTKEQAKEYFDKRDARRAAEYRIKKAIEKMNVDKERDSEMFYKTVNNTIGWSFIDTYSSTPKHLTFHNSIRDYMLEHHTEDYKIYFEIE